MTCKLLEIPLPLYHDRKTGRGTTATEENFGSYVPPPVRFLVGCKLQGIYCPRNPKASDFYACVEDNFEELERVYDDKYQKEHGFWRPVIREVIHKYLDCGDLHHGFARVRCSSCHAEFLLAFSCKGR